MQISHKSGNVSVGGRLPLPCLVIPQHIAEPMRRDEDASNQRLCTEKRLKVDECKSHECGRMKAVCISHFLKGYMDTHAGGQRTPVLAAQSHGVILSKGTRYAGAGEAADG